MSAITRLIASYAHNSANKTKLNEEKLKMKQSKA